MYPSVPYSTLKAQSWRTRLILTTSAQLETASESRGRGPGVAHRRAGPEEPQSTETAPRRRAEARRPPESPRGGGERLPRPEGPPRPSPARLPAAAPAPPPRPPALARLPGPSPGRRFSLTCLSRCRRWTPSTPPFPTRRRRHRERQSQLFILFQNWSMSSWRQMLSVAQ